MSRKLSCTAQADLAPVIIAGDLPITGIEAVARLSLDPLKCVPLPLEVWRQVALHMSTRELAKGLAQLCKAFRHLDPSALCLSSAESKSVFLTIIPALVSVLPSTPSDSCHPTSSCKCTRKLCDLQARLSHGPSRAGLLHPSCFCFCSPRQAQSAVL